MSSENNIDASGNTIDASGNTIDASGNIIDVSGNIIGNINDNNIVISGTTSFFSVFNEFRKLSVNYGLDYDKRKNTYIKKINIGIKNWTGRSLRTSQTGGARAKRAPPILSVFLESPWVFACL